MNAVHPGLAGVERLRFEKRYLTTRDLPQIVEREGGSPRGRVLRRTCRWCGEDLSGRQTSYCSAECREEVYIRMGHHRYHVKRRDKGVCADCGLDTELLERVLRHCNGSQRGLDPDHRWSLGAWKWKSWGAEILTDLGFTTSNQSLWEADHVIPVSAGGGCCGLDNYRTLCQRCHRKDTAILAKRRADERKGQAAMELG